MPDAIQGQNEPQAQGDGKQPVELPTTQEPQVTGELPDDASERTKREFEKLKEHNKQLADKVNALESNIPRPPSILETYLNGQTQVPLSQQMPTPMALPPMQQFAPNLSQAKAEGIRQELIDRDGYVDAGELERRLKTADEAERRAREAEIRANQALERIGRFEADQKNAKAKQLYQEFPELNPSNDAQYSQAFSEAVADEMLLQIVKTGQQDPILAAAKLAPRFRQSAPVTPTPAQQARSQATAPNRGQVRPGALKNTDLEDLRKQSLINNKAMEERIRRAGI